MVKLADGSGVRCDALAPGDTVWTPDGPAEVRCCVRIPPRLQILAVVGELHLSPTHPVKFNGRWVPARDVAQAFQRTTEPLYNFVLSAGHTIRVSGIECVTLCHGFSDEGVKDSYWSSAVLDDLAEMPGWAAGRVELHLTPGECGRRRGEAAQQAALPELGVELPSIAPVTPELLLKLHLKAMGETRATTGFRAGNVTLPGQAHRPPAAADVSDLVEKYCVDTNALIASGHDAEVVGAFCLWWVNSVHPFSDGNGRTARGLCFLVMSLLGANIPADIHTRFRREHRAPYLAGLRAANAACGFCACCPGVRKEPAEAVAALADLLRA